MKCPVNYLQVSKKSQQHNISKMLEVSCYKDYLVCVCVPVSDLVNVYTVEKKCSILVPVGIKLYRYNKITWDPPQPPVTLEKS